ncbi:MAG: FprA family A-type flavoprotein [Candidatus Korarchaeota archaeon]|nr:FprA family A-type flavoprotein [Candidatus Korarchaeota archaeon]
MSWFKREIAEGVTLVRILNTKLPRFENFWPIPNGTSYNFYVVEGSEGAALIDGADFRFSKEFFEALESVIRIEDLRYVITQHTEPDHSGTLAEVMRRAGEAVLLGTKQALSIGEALADFPMDRAKEVRDGDEVSLGNKTLRFVLSPMVHWPDTMLTYLVEDSILFTCDLFGSHGASEKVFYDEAPDSFELLDYYASILMPYHAMAAKAVAKVRELNPKIVAPSHGALHREIEGLLSTYESWTSWKPLKKALVVVGSQYENTARAAEAAAEGLRDVGLEVALMDSAETDPDDLLAHTLEAAAILVATSTHNGHPFLGITFYLDLLREYRPKNKVAAVLGSFGWGGGGTRAVKKELEALGIPVVDELAFKGKPKESDLSRAKELGKRLGEEALKLL